MTSLERQYRDYVEHPRYGRSPRFTGLHPDAAGEPVLTSWWTSFDDQVGMDASTTGKGRAIEGTAIEADTSAQPKMMFPFTHYYDVDRKCHSCGKRFIFFAEEQKYWYEVLNLYGGVNCHHCIVCRKQRQHLRWLAKDFAVLSALPDRSSEQTLDLVEKGIALVEAKVFAERRLCDFRHLLKGLPPEALTTPRAKVFSEHLWPLNDKA